MDHSTSGNAWLIRSLSLMMFAAGAAAGIVGPILWQSGKPHILAYDGGNAIYSSVGVGLMCLAVLLGASGAVGLFVAGSALKLENAPAPD